MREMRPIWVIVIIVFTTAILASGVTYYFVDAKVSKDKDQLQAQIDDLTGKLANTNSSSTISEVTNTNANINSNNNSNLNSNNISQSADWKTYTNNDLGLSLQYPSDWTYNKFDQTAGETTFNDADDHWVINIGVGNTTKKLDEIARAKIMELGGGAAGGSGVVNTDASIGGIAAKKITAPVEGAGQKIMYLVLSNGKLFTINLFAEDNTTDKIISTISFIK
ncbi:MAG: hypothetical protein WC107_01375 [Patescibacteria group bacterium]